MTSLLRKSRPRAAAAKPSAANAAAPFTQARSQQNPMGMAAALEDLRSQGVSLAPDEASEEQWMEEVDAAQGQWLQAAEQGNSSGPPGDPGANRAPVNPMFPPSSYSTEGGLNLSFPDVCKVPAPPAPFVPIPYPNLAGASSASKATSKAESSSKKATTGTKGGGGRSRFLGPSSTGSPTGTKVEPSQRKVKVAT